MKGAVSAIMKKDIRQVLSSKQTLVPMIVVPLVFSIFIPLSMIIPSLGSFTNVGQTAQNGDISMYLSLIAGNGDILNQMNAIPTDDLKMIYLFLNYLFMPMFMLVPVMASSIISAYCIVGEKEKKTLETLLYAPVPMQQMFWAKVLAAFIPAICITAISVTIYGCIVNFGCYSMFGWYIFPTSNWYIFLFVLTPAFSLLATILMVFVSAKAKTFQSAQQWSIIVIMPVLALMMVQTMGAMFISSAVFAVIGGCVLAVDLVLVFKGLGRFTRQKLIN